MIRFVAFCVVAAAATLHCPSSYARHPHQGMLGHFGSRGSNPTADQVPWHGDYYYLKTGQPTALVVPPTVTHQTNFSWGVSQNVMTPVLHQFKGLPPNGAGGGIFRATPVWPSHTNQFGVYPVRAPW